MEDTILESREIIERAIKENNPYAIVGLFSGGSDSQLVMELLKELGVKLDFILHVNTGTGLPQTLDFVRDYCNKYPAKYIEASAGNSYEKYVMRKGFFGKGKDAHTYAYHILKAEHLRKGISQNIRQRQRNKKILLINGIRIEESDNRKDNYGDETINIYPSFKNDVWVNLIHWWTDTEKKEYLHGIDQNPVSKALGRSGECMCGTMQTQADRMAASDYCPAWGKWLDALEKQVIANGFPWRWGENINKAHLMERDGQMNMFTDFMPMCVGCKSRRNKSAQAIEYKP